LIRLAATDLDGTLLRSDGTVSRRTCRAIHGAEEAGILLALVTGRPPRWMAPVAAATGHAGVAICANGALLYDLHTEQVVGSTLLAAPAALDTVAALRAAVPGLSFAAEFTPGFGHEASYRHGWDLGEVSVRVGAAEEILDQPVVKLLARHPTMDRDELLTLARELLGAGVTVTSSSTTEALLEISAPGVTKATALAGLAERAGIPAADVVAFGDMPNDLPMLDWAGRAVAVANAHPDVLALADEVTASNDDDGVALVLERLAGSSRAG
jgi:Cof subfamily protein (haloacid dehalogenase superfamily)